jgi:hypothetical protein
MEVRMNDNNNLIEWDKTIISICFKRSILKAIENCSGEKKICLDGLNEPENYPNLQKTIVRRIRKYFNMETGLIWKKYPDSRALLLCEDEDERETLLRAFYFLDAKSGKKRRVLIFWAVADKFGEAKYFVKIEKEVKLNYE